MGRFVDPEDIGNVAVYLCSPAAKFVTGVVLLVDGRASVGFKKCDGVDCGGPPPLFP